MRMPPYLLLRPSGYYFRYVIPHDLRDTFGKSEIRKSLATHDRRQALLMAATLSANVLEKIRSLRNGMVDIFGMDPKKIEKFEINEMQVGNVKLSGIKVDSNNPNDVAAFSQALENIGRLQPAAPAPAPQEQTRSVSPEISKKAENFLVDVLEIFILEKTTARLKDGTLDDYEEAIGLLIDVVGNKPLSHYTDEDANLYVKTLQTLPPNRNKKTEYRGKTIREMIALLKETKDKPMSVSTIDKHISNCSSFFNWALTKKKYIFGNNIFVGQKIQNKAQREETHEENRRPFYKDELKKIFSPANYASRVTPHDYWFPLIAAYSGLRLNEISQLYLSDILLSEDVWVFDINKNNPDKKLKTKTSKRLVPVHPKLIELGFMDFVEEMKGYGHDRLFWWLKKAADGYGRRPSRNFASYLTSLDITGSDKVFHSFRHTFNNTLKEKRLDEESRSELMGHSHKSVNSEVYSATHRITNKLEFINRLEYDGIDFVSLSYKKRDFADFYKAPDKALGGDEKSDRRKASAEAHAKALEERKKRSLAAGKP